MQEDACNALASLRKTSIEELEALSATGKELKCSVGEASYIDAEIRRRTWHVSLAKMNKGKPELAVLEDMVSSAAECEVSLLTYSISLVLS